MEVKAKFDHFNVNVTDLNRSIEFYSKALGFTEARRKEAADGSFVLVYLTDGVSPFLLELTWLRDHKEAYELGENESHLCVRVSGDYNKVRAYHKEWVVYVSRMKLWDSILFTIQTTIGLRYFQPKRVLLYK